VSKKETKTDKVVAASNRKARHQYVIEDVFEAGLSLKGPEVKSVRAGNLRLTGAFGRVDKGQAYIHNLYIAPYPQNTIEDLSPTRTRKLLLHRREIVKMRKGVETGGRTLVPLEVYFLRGWAKMSIALGKSRRGPDKREDLKKKATARELGRSFKGRFKV